jgi:hypothetical protein
MPGAPVLTSTCPRTGSLGRCASLGDRSRPMPPGAAPPWPACSQKTNDDR